MHPLACPAPFFTPQGSVFGVVHALLGLGFLLCLPCWEIPLCSAQCGPHFLSRCIQESEVARPLLLCLDNHPFPPQGARIPSEAKCIPSLRPNPRGLARPEEVRRPGMEGHPSNVTLLGLLRERRLQGTGTGTGTNPGALPEARSLV